jgi:hypothetical protein
VTEVMDGGRSRLSCPASGSAQNEAEDTKGDTLGVGRTGRAGLKARTRLSWLTRGVLAIGLASMFLDLGHETTTALLPVFLTATLGGPAVTLGVGCRPSAWRSRSGSFAWRRSHVPSRRQACK